MLNKTRLAASVAVACITCSAQAQVNPSGETTPPTQIAAQTMYGVAELASNAGIANIQVTAGQTLTNSVLRVAEG